MTNSLNCVIEKTGKEGKIEVFLINVLTVHNFVTDSLNATEMTGVLRHILDAPNKLSVLIA